MIGIAAALSHHSDASSQPNDSGTDQQQQELQDQIQRSDEQGIEDDKKRLQDQEAEEDREQQIRDEGLDQATTQMEINNSREEAGQ